MIKNCIEAFGVHGDQITSCKAFIVSESIYFLNIRSTFYTGVILQVFFFEGKEGGVF